MAPPFQITSRILEQISKIERLLGRLESLDHPKPQPHLRKSNRVRTVQGSLAIEGNTLNVGIFKGSKVSHVAPPADNVPYLMKDLFEFLKKDKNHALIKSAVFHYELEFIHPFEDGNGRIGRFWHSLLLTHYHPVFEFTPVESLIKANQPKYYDVLGDSDIAGNSTAFIEFALDMAHQALDSFVDALRPEPSTTQTRLERAKSHFGNTQFSRKYYMKLHKTISTATASRDRKAGIDAGMLIKEGELALTAYRFEN